MMWVLRRVQSNGPSDYANVHKIQDGLKLTPLKHWGKSYSPPATSPVDASVDTKTPPLVQLDKMTGSSSVSPNCLRNIHRMPMTTRSFP